MEVYYFYINSKHFKFLGKFDIDKKEVWDDGKGR